MRRKNSNRSGVGGKSDAQQSTIWRPGTGSILLLVCFPVVNFSPAFDCLNRLLFLNRLFLCKYKYLPVKFSRIIRESPGYWRNQIRRLKPNLVAPRGCLKPIFVRSKGLARYVRPKRKYSLYRVVFQSLPSISREIRQFVPSDCLQGNKDDGNHSSPPPRPRYKCMERGLLTRGDCLREVQLLTEEAPLGGGRTCV